MTRFYPYLTFTILVAIQAELLQAQKDRELAARLLDEFIAKYESQGMMSGSFFIDLGNGEYYERSVGFANDEFEIKNAPQTRYLIASLTKSFTAAAILRLHELGRLLLSDPVAKFFPEYPRQNLRVGDQEVTIHHLLNHTSGLPDAYETAAIKSKEYFEPFGFREFLEAIKDLPLIFSPGERMEYSNIGYIFLGEIVRRVTGGKYTDFVKSELFAKADLTETTVGFPLGKEPLVATTYERVDSGRRNFFAMHDIRMLHTGEVFTDGNNYATARDVAKWVQGLAKEKVLNKDSLEKMFLPSAEEYGYGWRIPEWGAKDRILWHGGYYTGYTSRVMHSLTTGVTVVALMNQPEGSLHDESLSTFHSICSKSFNR